MLLTLEPLQAQEGDCLLLYWGTLAQPKLAVIDGGPGNVYENTLRPRLEEIRTKRGVAPLPVDLVMVSHVDSDHILGVRKLFQQLKDEIDKKVSPAQRQFTARRLWHNTFNDILGDPQDQFFKTLTASVQAAVGGSPNPLLLTRLVDAYKKRHPAAADAEASAADIARVLAGHADGRTLRDTFSFLLANKSIATLNTPFKKNGQPTLAMLHDPVQTVGIDSLHVTVFGPMEHELQALQKEFDDFITEKGLVESSLLTAYSDDSVPNLSSIVCLVESGGKRILLTGDARGDKILSGLTKAGILGATPLKVDILKVPHHGSDRNVKQEFFERIVADTYVFSGNGKFGNPERETLTMLTNARGKAAQYDMILTYPVPQIDPNRKIAAAHKKNAKPWNPTTDSLKSFFAQRKNDGFKFVVRAGAPVKINLGDEVPPW